MLEYSRRSGLRSRNVLAATGQSTGKCLFDETLRAGACSIAGNGSLREGGRADCVALAVAPFADFALDILFDQWIFGEGVKVEHIWIGVRKRVGQGCHLDREQTEAHFSATVMKLRGTDQRAEMTPSPTLHQRILSELERNIVSGDWPLGFRLPFEVELAKSYNVSRMTVNKVLTRLADAGLIERRRKSGSFVAMPRVQAAILEIHDIETEVRQLQAAYSFQLLHEGRHVAKGEERTLFELENTRSAFTVDLLDVSCLHFANDTPFCHEMRLVNLDVVPEAVHVDFTTISPGKWLQNQVPWSTAEHKIYAIAADAQIAKWLGLAEKTPCLVVQRCTWNEKRGSEMRANDKGVVTFVRFTYPADRHALVARFTPAASV